MEEKKMENSYESYRKVKAHFDANRTDIGKLYF